jgi:SNF2 family DNA or RNA helicase
MVCPKCSEPFTGYPRSLPQEDVNRIKRKAKAKTKPEIWIGRLKNGATYVPASIKTLAFKAQLLNWKKADPNVKIVAFSEWCGMLDILEAVCKAEGWGCVKINGTVEMQERHIRLHDFKSKKEISVLLATKKVGGLGLNLTEATRVAIMDPWWNKAAEKQAFGRVRRIGQTQKTQLTRFYIEGGMEQMMMAMQKRKHDDIEMAW